MKYKPELDFAIETAREAGHLLMNKYFGKFEAVAIREDSWSAAATEADKAADALFARRIKEKYPSAKILGEESETLGESEYTWRVDAPDGTNSFKRGNPEFSVLVSLERQNRLLIGVVYRPYYDELFYAHIGEGAWSNRNPEGEIKRLYVSPEKSLREAVISFNAAVLSPQYVEVGQKILRTLSELHPQIRFRTRENTGIDLAEVATGCSTVHIGMGAKPHDYAAGTLLVKCAGGKTTDFEGRELKTSMGDSHMVASNGRVHGEVLEIVKMCVIA